MTIRPPDESDEESSLPVAKPKPRARRPPRGSTLLVSIDEIGISFWVSVQAERSRYVLPALIEAMEQAADHIDQRLAGDHETNRKGGPARRAEAAKVAAKQAPELRASATELRVAAATLRALPRPAELLPKPRKA